MKKNPISTAIILLEAGVGAIWVNKGMELATAGDMKGAIIGFTLGIILNTIAAYDIRNLY